jgi:hypothetical protein
MLHSAVAAVKAAFEEAADRRWLKWSIAPAFLLPPPFAPRCLWALRLR